MNWTLPLALALAIGAITPQQLAAQAGPQLVDQGVAAYESLELDAAIELLNRALALRGRGALAEPDRARALTYLGAAELLRNNRTTAVTAFRDLVILAPRVSPDPRRFPATVQRVYDEVRETTKATAIDVPEQAGIVAGNESYPVRIYASSFHTIYAVVVDDGGALVDTLVAGPVRDSITILWDALGSAGQPVPPGRYTIVVTSSVSPPAVLRSVRVPLKIRRGPADTLPHLAELPDSAFLPERTAVVPPARIVLPAIIASVAAVTLPTLVAGADDPSAGRFAVGAGIALGGVATYLFGGRGRRIPENVARNDAARRRWERRQADIVSENRQRRDVPRLVIESGPPERREGGE